MIPVLLEWRKCQTSGARLRLFVLFIVFGCLFLSPLQLLAFHAAVVLFSPRFPSFPSYHPLLHLQSDGVKQPTLVPPQIPAETRKGCGCKHNVVFLQIACLVVRRSCRLPCPVARSDHSRDGAQPHPRPTRGAIESRKRRLVYQKSFMRCLLFYFVSPFPCVLRGPPDSLGSTVWAENGEP